MEREAHSLQPKLIEVAARDYPSASEILVSFPDQWEFIDTLQDEGRQLYIAAFPLSREHPTRHHFEGLAPEINVSLVFYRLYKFFEPWQMPTVVVNWDARRGQGEVTGMGNLRVHLQPMGQAQVWYGLSHAVLWECYFHETRRRSNWQETLAQVWQKVEQDLKVPKIFTLPHEPTIEQGYTDFLSRIGYAVDPQNPEWWSKIRRLE